MDTSAIVSRFTVFFESPFWVGIYEVEHEGRLWASRWVFGAEPSAEAVYDLARGGFGALRAGMTHALPLDARPEHAVNFKRMQREIRRAVAEEGIGTKSQEALKQLAGLKIERRKATRAERDAEKERKREIARGKAKARHRGR